jgi:hypothetical protein
MASAELIVALGRSRPASPGKVLVERHRRRARWGCATRRRGLRGRYFDTADVDMDLGAIVDTTAV